MFTEMYTYISYQKRAKKLIYKFPISLGYIFCYGLDNMQFEDIESSMADKIYFL